MRRLQTFVGVLALLVTWALIFLTLTMLTELAFAPWDTVVTLPEPGTWQRTLNDFVDLGIGKYVLSVPLLVASMTLTWAALRQQPQAAWRYALGNLVFVLLVWAVFNVAALLNNALFPYPPVLYDPNYRGYHRSIVPGLAFLGMRAAWLLFLRRTTFSPRAKAA